MRWRDIAISLVCVVIAGGLFYVAGSRLDYINEKRVEMKLVANEPLENAPPSLAFATVAMGAFRGLVVDILWIRADAMKEKGLFFDAKQLADWITVLQPRFASVWDFQSWNMAYNISVAIPASQPEERWRWVRNGFELLRDKGILLNPKSINLYHKLAWIFQHKIGGVTDDAHRFYKLQIAMSMQNLLGPKPSNVFFDALSDAPQNVSGFMEDETGAKLINDLRAVSDIFEDDEVASSYLAMRANPSQYDPEIFEVFDKYREDESNILRKFDTFARAYKLRNEWKLDPDLMIECNEFYGPKTDDPNNSYSSLNWQHPDSHAIYWAHKGLQVAGGNPETADELNADRIVMHSLQNLYRSGKIFIFNEPVEVEQESFGGGEPEKVTMYRPNIYLRPDNRMFDVYNEVTLKVIDKYNDEKRMRVEAIKNGHRNMLKNAVLSYYQAGNKEKALEIYNDLRRLYPDKEEFHGTLVEFCRMRLAEELRSVGITDVREIVLAMLSESYFRFALGDDQEAFGREQMAKEIYQNYQKEFGDENAGLGRVSLTSFSMMKFMALLDFIYDPMYPQTLRNQLLNRIEVERPELFKELQKRGEEFKEQVEDSEKQLQGQQQ